MYPNILDSRFYPPTTNGKKNVEAMIEQNI